MEETNQEQPNVIRYGLSPKGVQTYLNKETGVRSTANGAQPGRRIPHEQVGAAISMYYGGLSTREIKRTFEHVYDFVPSTATIYEWVTDCTRMAQAKVDQNKADTGNVWVADEQVQRIGGKKTWLWTVMDAKTRYILASRLSVARTIPDAEALFKEARSNAQDKPKRIITDGLPAYREGIERVFGGDTRHEVAEGIRYKSNNNLMERVNGTIRQRTKVMRGLKTPETAKAILEGWALHYNYFKPHGGLNERTPAQVAGIPSPALDWEDVAKQDVRPYSEFRVRREKERTRPILRVRRMGGRM